MKFITSSSNAPAMTRWLGSHLALNEGDGRGQEERVQEGRHGQEEQSQGPVRRPDEAKEEGQSDQQRGGGDRAIGRFVRATKRSISRPEQKMPPPMPRPTTRA